MNFASWLSRLLDRRPLFGHAPFPSDEEVAEASRKYGGMTMNERLVISGLIDQWDAAVAKGDRKVLLRICAQVGIADGPTGRSWIADSVLNRRR